MKSATAPAKRTSRASLAKTVETAQFVDLLRSNPEAAYQRLMDEVGQIAFEQMRVRSEDASQLASARGFIKLMMDARREATAARKENLAREKWEFDVVRACFEHLQLLDDLNRDKTQDESARIAKARTILFGDAAHPLPCVVSHPRVGLTRA